MGSTIGVKTCQKPNCTKGAEETYRDSQGNTLLLCEKHYYRALTSSDSAVLPQPDPPLDVPDDSDPFWWNDDDDDPLKGEDYFRRSSDLESIGEDEG